MRNAKIETAFFMLTCCLSYEIQDQNGLLCPQCSFSHKDFQLLCLLCYSLATTGGANHDGGINKVHSPSLNTHSQLQPVGRSLRAGTTQAKATDPDYRRRGIDQQRETADRAG